MIVSNAIERYRPELPVIRAYQSHINAILVPLIQFNLYLVGSGRDLESGGEGLERVLPSFEWNQLLARILSIAQMRILESNFGEKVLSKKKIAFPQAEKKECIPVPGGISVLNI